MSLSFKYIRTATKPLYVDHKSRRCGLVLQVARLRLKFMYTHSYVSLVAKIFANEDDNDNIRPTGSAFSCLVLLAL